MCLNRKFIDTTSNFVWWWSAKEGEERWKKTLEKEDINLTLSSLPGPLRRHTTLYPRASRRRRELLGNCTAPTIRQKIRKTHLNFRYDDFFFSILLAFVVRIFIITLLYNPGFSHFLYSWFSCIRRNYQMTWWRVKNFSVRDTDFILQYSSMGWRWMVEEPVDRR